MPRYIVAVIGECCPQPHLIVVEGTSWKNAVKKLQRAGFDTGDVATVKGIEKCKPFEPQGKRTTNCLDH